MKTKNLKLFGFVLAYVAATGFGGLFAASYTDEVALTPLFPSRLEWCGKNEPSEQDSKELLDAISVFAASGIKSGFEALERFVQSHPDSAWTPGLETSMAEHYRGHGRYTLALAHWETAWKATKKSSDFKTQMIAVRAVTGWTRLLASLGEKQKVIALFKELEQLGLSLGSYATTIEQTRGGLGVMTTRPGESYRCGSYALGHLVRILNMDDLLSHRLFQTPSPDGGFSVSQLLDLAVANGLQIEALHRPPGAEVPVPAIVHWRLNHYAALLEKNGETYRVVDPTFGGELWMDQETLDSEASGIFLMPKDKVPKGWQPLSPAECASTYGKGYGNSFPDADDGPPNDCGGSDDEDSDCDPPSANDGAGGGGTPPNQPPACCSGGSSDPTGGADGYDPIGSQIPGAGFSPFGSQIPGAYGMPQWRVSEPYITLWLHDTPMVYHQSNNKRQQLKLTYKHRGEIKGTGIGGFGDKWSCTQLGFLQYPGNGTAYNNYAGGGGIFGATMNGGATYKGGSVLSMNSGVPELLSPTGEKNRYGYSYGYITGITNYFLTQRLDRYRRLWQYTYETIPGGVRATNIADLDGRSMVLKYTNVSYPNLITSVIDPYSHTNYFIYDNLGRLTNIVDMIGLSSSFKYDSNNNITNMVTPYGTNSFQYFSGTNLDFSTLTRGVIVTEATGDKQLYTYIDVSTNNSAWIPCAGDGASTYRLSFHWNRAQYVAISAQGKTNVLAMPDGDYQIAEVKHWLHGPDPLNLTVSDTMDSMAGPFDPNLGTRPGCVSLTWQGQNGALIGDSSSGGLKRIASISLDGARLIDISRNSLGRPLIFTLYNSYGSSASYTNVFDASGRNLLQEWGPRGEMVRGYGYSSVVPNLLTSVTNAMGDVIRYTHDTNTMKVTSVTFPYPGGLVRTNTYYSSGPSQGFLQTRIDIGFRTNSYSYLNGNVVVRTNALGLVTTNTWDNLSRLVCVTFPDGTTLSNRYANLDIVATKDRLNQWTYFGYNAVRQLTAVTNVNGQVTQYSYCGCGNPSQMTRWNGATAVNTQFSYDMAGRLTNTTYADGYQLSRTYDGDSFLSKVTDSSGRGIQLDYAQIGTGFPLADAYVVSPDQTEVNALLSRQFDEYGRVTNSISRNNVVVTNAYDFLGRLTQRRAIGPDRYFPLYSGLETFTYNAQGLTNYTDSMGQLTTFMRDSAGRLLYETNANLEVLQFTYNPMDEMLTLKDPKNQTTTWKYDSYGRITNKVDALGTNAFTYQYDPNDRLTNRTTAAKGATRYVYDQLGNLTNVVYQVSSSLVFQYDGLNRLTNMVDGIGPTAFTWTLGNQLASETGPWVDDKVAYAYTTRFRSVLSLLQPNSSPWTQSYVYDEFARLTNITSAAGVFGYQYAPLSTSGGQTLVPDLVQQLNYPSGAYSQRSYDPLAELTNSVLMAPDAVTVLDAHQYSYNLSFQRTQQVFQAGNYMNYAYDKIGQLKSATGFEAGAASRLHERFGYGYDPVWNLNNRTNYALTETLSANAANELTSVSRTGTLTVAGTVGPTSPPVSVTVSGTGLSTGAATVYQDGTWARTNASPANGQSTYTATATDGYGRTSQDSVSVNLATPASYIYDANGNLVNDGQRSFSYDDENQLTSVQVAGLWRSEFVYDGLMRRRQRVDYSWVSGAWSTNKVVLYVYAGRSVIQERDANNLPLVTYTRGRKLLARTDCTVSSSSTISSPHSYYHSDANDNVTCLINSNNAVVARYAYDPFGNILAKSGPLADLNLYRFSSKEIHSDSGLVSYTYRYYDPNLQKWISRDPLGEAGFEVLRSHQAFNRAFRYRLVAELIGKPNLYGFVENNPISHRDRNGLCDDADPDIEREFYDLFPERDLENEYVDPPGGTYLEDPDLEPTFDDLLNELESDPFFDTFDRENVPGYHGGAEHMRAIRDEVARMESLGYRDIRVNQQQRDAQGNVVGNNRPDVQGINPRTGQRENVEFDHSPSNSFYHYRTLQRNDPNAKNDCRML